MRISDRGQVTVPKRLRQKYGLWATVEVEFVETRDGLKLQKVVRKQHPVEAVAGIVGKGVDVDRYLDEVRGR